jgi:hypothetical protein
MVDSRVKVSSLIENQLPAFVREEFPLVSEFLSQYYRSIENQGQVLDILSNIDQYVKLDTLTSVVESTILTEDIESYVDSIKVSSTSGFPEKYGLIQIDSEIITYTSKTQTSFEGCLRGFSGTSSYKNDERPDLLVFSKTDSDNHSSGTTVTNLSVLFLKEFLYKIKYQFNPGFEGRQIDADINQNIFIKQAKDFYSSKGTDQSFKILFKILYGEDVEVIKPRDYLFQPSDADYELTKDIVVERIAGNPEDLVNSTIYQDPTDDFISSARGTVTKVEKILRGDREYYIVSLDYGSNKDITVSGSVFGEFSVHPKTILINSVETFATVLDVDSTVGFPDSGEILAYVDENTTLLIEYTSKSLTQFFGCSGVDQPLQSGQELFYNSYAYGTSNETEETVKLRVSGVLSDITIPENTLYFNKGDSSKIVSLGSKETDFKFNNWFFNVASGNRVEQLLSLDNFGKTYSVSTISNHKFRTGDEIKIISSIGMEYNGIITKVADGKEVIISSDSRIDLGLIYKIERRLSKINSINYPELSLINSNVQNVYTDSESSLYVASPSIPSYFGEPLLTSDRSSLFSTNFVPSNPLDVTQIVPLDDSFTSYRIITSVEHNLLLEDIVNISLSSAEVNKFKVTKVVSPSIIEVYGTSGILYENLKYSLTKIYTEIIFNRRHGFYTGDAVVYTPGSDNNKLNIEKGIYFVKKIDNFKIKLSRSRENIFNNIFIELEGVVTDNKLSLFDFSDNLYNIKSLESQNLIRKIQSPNNEPGNYEVKPGKIGISLNGTEFISYKSKDTLYYGPIESVSVTNGGRDYDVINPPLLIIEDSIGVGATGFCEVEGQLERIDIIEGGFDYLNDPIISITGGNGSGAVAKAKLTSFDHIVPFNSRQGSGLVDLNNNILGFSTYHKFRDAETVIYQTDGQKAVGGISTGSEYYVSVIDEYRVKLHSKYEDAVVGINTLDLGPNFGEGVHKLQSRAKKRRITSIGIIDPGSGYTNRKVYVSLSGISTFSNTIHSKSHGFKSGEIVTYTTTGNPIGGLSNNTNYFVTRIDNDNYKLSEIGQGELNNDFYYQTKQYINLTSVGTSEHYFNYPEIQVKVDGVIGVSTFTQQDFSAIIKPVFRGQIKSVNLKNNGSNYGSQEILNYQKQPLFSLDSGSGARLTPVIINGRITDVLINNPGRNYNSQPTIEITSSESGFGAILVPVLKDGKLSSIKVINGGIGYDNRTTILTVVSSGAEGNFEASIKRWGVNLFERILESNQISEDDGVIVEGTNRNYGLQYTHLYSGRKLRRSLFSSRVVRGRRIFEPDLKIEDGKEIESQSHSPIIGWAYDGNPIYGPYGYENPTGGKVKKMKSGYVKIQRDNRPSDTLYSIGFFVEDYIHDQKVGDLDENNGRFCVTPEYPNGVYAYFSTIDLSLLDTTGPFENYFRPSFPYLIGNTFKSKPIDFNFDTKSNQDEFDLVSEGLIRNTYPYNISENDGYYNYLIDPNKIKNPITKVKYSLPGSVDYFRIISGGENYKVGDVLEFDNDRTEVVDSAYAQVSRLDGKEVLGVSANKISVEDIVFYPLSSSTEFIGISTVPHNLLNEDLISISGISTTNTKLEKSYKIRVLVNNLVLSSNVSSQNVTGIVTYFEVSGNLNSPYLRENDIFELNSEAIKVLKVDSKNSRILVLRTQGSGSHSAGSILLDRPRKFAINTPDIKRNNYKIEREVYFDPTNSVGIGTDTEITIYNSGIGLNPTKFTLPERSIYIQDHGFSTGERLVYSSNGGEPLLVDNVGLGSTFVLNNNSLVYIAKISNDLIGISTNMIGLGTDGNFVGIGTTLSTLYFVGFGTSNYHSFKTYDQSIIKGQISRNTATVSTASTHGLALNDYVDVTLTSTSRVINYVKYDEINRRFVLNPRNILGEKIDTVTSTIRIEDHGFVNGQKVVYSSSLEESLSELETNKIYYVYVVDSNRIKLCDNYYQTTLSIPTFVTIETQEDGILWPINPEIKAFSNQTLIFDVSDNSLSFISGVNRYPAFELEFFRDGGFKDRFETTKTSNQFEVVRRGLVGVSSESSVEIGINDNFPESLYYRLTPLRKYNDIDVPSVKTEIIIDNENIQNNNRISINKSSYSGTYRVSGITSTTFTYNLSDYPEKSSYNLNESTITYTTDSKNAFGVINDIFVKNKGKGYRYLPGVSSVISNTGKGAIILPRSRTIGRIQKLRVDDIGFDYPSDLTLKPTVKFSDIVKVDPLTSFKSIGITSTGQNYTSAPDLVVVDGFTKQPIPEVRLRYNLGDAYVTILRNTYGIYNASPEIIPINNSNGISIRTIKYNDKLNEVTVELDASFSTLESFPFHVGERIIIENTNVKLSTGGKGYNSSDYNYKLFEITEVDPNIGGSEPTIKFNLDGFLNSGEYPGEYDTIKSSGKVTPEIHFPIFDIVLQKNDFIIGETIRTDSAVGIVEYWDSRNEYLKVLTTDTIKNGEKIIADTTKTQGILSEVISSKTRYDVSSSSIVNRDWAKETGFLNNTFQRIHNNDYYQYFSYSLKSKIQVSEWENPVSTLNHVAGFKKFSDLIVENTNINESIRTDQNEGDFGGTSDFYSVVDVDSTSDFDLVSENNLTIGTKLISDEVIFNSRVIQDHLKSVGNRVLVIDDISGQFNNTSRETIYSIVDTFKSNEVHSKKYLTYVRDNRYSSDRQAYIVNVVHDGVDSYITQYARVNGKKSIGSFDFVLDGDDANLLFYPDDYRVNDYSLSILSYDFNNFFDGIESYDFGCINFNTETQTILASVGTQTLLTLELKRAAKFIIQLEDSNGNYQLDEISIIHDGINAQVLEYGKIGNFTGIATYYGYVYGGNGIGLDLIPGVNSNVTIKAKIIYITFSDKDITSTNSVKLNTSLIKSDFIQVTSDDSPTEVVISKYYSENGGYNASHYTICLDDVTLDSQIGQIKSQFIEMVVVDDGIDTFNVEYGKLYTDTELGTFRTRLNSGYTEILFTPIPNKKIELRSFSNIIGTVDLLDPNNKIDLNTSTIKSNYNYYTGTERDVRRSFNLLNNGYGIFERDFNSEDLTTVNISDSTIRIPNHFFNSGEKVRYITSGIGTQVPLQIKPTNIPGIGLTTLLPTNYDLYAIKYDQFKIQLALTAENALKFSPEFIEVTNVGIGTQHKIIASNQNLKSLITIDNVVQIPIRETLTKTNLTSEVFVTDNNIIVDNIFGYYAGDIIRIDNEILRVNSIGVVSPNSIEVERNWMGTKLSSHPSGSVVTKLQGNYNIVDNTINFSSAPYGKMPVGILTSKNPDERDFTGISTHSTFSGRIFLRTGKVNSKNDPYDTNYLFDDISTEFNGITTSFALKQNGNNIDAILEENPLIFLRNSYQTPRRLTPVNNVVGNYYLTEQNFITTLNFNSSPVDIQYDVNRNASPIGGVIVSVGSTRGLGYQPLLRAGGSAVVSAAGTIQSIVVENPGSGYRAGIQTSIKVGVQKQGLNSIDIEYVGLANVSEGRVTSVIITNPGSGYNQSDRLKVVFDSPLPYSNIPLIYSSSSSGIGKGAVIDINVGFDYTVTDYTIKSFGYAYKPEDVLTFSIGGDSGIPLEKIFDENVIVGDVLVTPNIITSVFEYDSPSSIEEGSTLTIDDSTTLILVDFTYIPLDEFQVTVTEVYNEEFAGWSMGQFEVFDSIDEYFDGFNVTFPLMISGQPKSILTDRGSNIDIQATLLVFINDVLQVPGQGYYFDGGSTITFAEPPKAPDPDYPNSGDKSQIIFYRGTKGIDVVDVDILETIKPGDTLLIDDDSIALKEDPRVISRINASDSVETNSYAGAGISLDTTYLRPINWYKQKQDVIINGKEVTKDRINYEPLISPVTNIIQNIGLGDTIFYVEGAKTFFDSRKENAQGKILSDIEVIDQYPLLDSNSISPEYSKVETITDVVYEGDFGEIVAIGTVMTEEIPYGLFFDFYISDESYLKDPAIIQEPLIRTSIQIGDYFVIKNSNVGVGFTSLRKDGSIIGTGSTYFDNIYQVLDIDLREDGTIIKTPVTVTGFETYDSAVIIEEYNELSVQNISSNITYSENTELAGRVTIEDGVTAIVDIDVTVLVIGVTLSVLVNEGGVLYVDEFLPARITTQVLDYNGMNFQSIKNTPYYGDYSWGKLKAAEGRLNPKEFESYTENGISGISSSPVIRRKNPLKYLNYT